MKNFRFIIPLAALCVVLSGCSHSAGDSSVGADGKLKHMAAQPNPPDLQKIIQSDMNANKDRITKMRQAANAAHGGGAVVLPSTPPPTQ